MLPSVGGSLPAPSPLIVTRDGKVSVLTDSYNGNSRGQLTINVT
jgi:hypothetical protein